MRHRKSGVKLNRTTSHRQAMFRNMVTSLLKYDRIKTTEAKAKELRKWADHIITLAKRGDLHARRLALSIVREKEVVHKIFEQAPERFGNRNGGYTRIIRLGHRPGDCAPLTLIELVASDDAPAQKTKPAQTKSESTVQPPAPAKQDEKETIAPDESIPADDADVVASAASTDESPVADAAASTADDDTADSGAASEENTEPPVDAKASDTEQPPLEDEAKQKENEAKTPSDTGEGDK